MEELRPIRVVHYGLGATGKAIARMVHEAPGMCIVGGIDQDPALVGKDVGEAAELGTSLGIPIDSNADRVLEETRPDIAVVATRSLLGRTYAELKTCLLARVNVVSTCEELVYPYPNNVQLAEELDALARRSGVSVLGVGVNPGFIMDLLPLLLTGPCSCVSRLSVVRVVDAAMRRASLHQRIGAGLTQVQFRDHMKDVCNRHIGLSESLYMIANTVGWTVEQVDERMEPIIAEDWIRSEYITVAPEQVAGLRQVAVGIVDGQEAIVLDWSTAVGTKETYDAVSISGVPPINLRIEGGLHGDQAAAAMVLHALRPTVSARCGLLTVTDIPPITYQAR